jgi:hypothetical protein
MIGRVDARAVRQAKTVLSLYLHHGDAGGLAKFYKLAPFEEE